MGVLVGVSVGMGVYVGVGVSVGGSVSVGVGVTVIFQNHQFRTMRHRPSYGSGDVTSAAEVLLVE